MSDKPSRMMQLLKEMTSCPCCNADRRTFEEWELFDFVAEATFSCGARVQLMPDSMSALKAADGCPSQLASKLDGMEEESDEAADNEAEEAA